jgi:CRISPR-associated protein Cas1|tara:strand:- start:497 stop:1486 length:990 start_codon:yes stop_codon:yes gene_type:complete
MSVLYIKKHGSVLRISGERFIVTQGKKKLAETPAFKIEQVVILGNGMITPQAMDYLMKKNIEVAYMSTSGRYRGKFQPPVSQNLPLRRAQYEMAGDRVFCLDISRALTEAKIRNSVYLIVKRGQKATTGAQGRKLRHALFRIEKIRSIEKLRGLEGAAASAYFQTYRQFLKDDMGFTKRLKHPPPDPVNILLSLGYTLLFNLVHSMINLVGMDPYEGFYHQYKFGHAALASDIMEPLRAPVVDSLVLRVINLRVIRKNDFERHKNKAALKNDGLKKYFAEYDKRLRAKRQFDYAGKSLDFRQIIEWQCRQLGRVLMGKESRYKPFLWGG